MSYKFIRETQLHLLMKVGNMIRIRAAFEGPSLHYGCG